METKTENDSKPVVIPLIGRIDSNNASDFEKNITENLDEAKNSRLILDADLLEYISSAGLRVILRLRKLHQDLRIINVIPHVYEVFDTTGFTEMMPIEKGYRSVSVEDAEVIGRGANGTIYRIDQDNVVKVYNNADALDDIQHERECARLALILGIPTAISYDIVRVGGSYGSVFELLKAKSFTEILINEPEKMDWCVQEYVKMMKLLHSTEVPEGKLPDMRETALDWAAFMKDHLPGEAGDKLLKLISGLPQDSHMIHGDYHTKNLVLQDGEVLLIDMDTLCVGHPVFELASVYNAYLGYSEYDHSVIRQFQGFDRETGGLFFHKALAEYLDTDDAQKIREVEDKARILGYTRLIRRSIRRNGMETERGAAEIGLWKAGLLELLEKTDTLLF